jgi:hypothetical protein
VLTAANPGDPLEDDYGLIDFGANAAAPTMYGMPVIGMASINTRNTICHDGIRTGIACGQLGDRLIGPQYLTTGMAPTQRWSVSRVSPDARAVVRSAPR